MAWDEEKLRAHLVKSMAKTMLDILDKRGADYKDWEDEAERLMQYWVEKHGALLISGDDPGATMGPVLEYWQAEVYRLETDFPLRKKAAS
jgi:hypothetical protein